MKMNEENSSNREVHEEIKTDLANGHISKTKITSTVPNTTLNEHNKEAYHKGYVQGEVSENHRKDDDQKVRDNDNAARGLLLGIILASVVGLVLGTTYFLNRRDETPILAPLVVPVPRANQPSPPPNSTRTIEKEKTIIEKIVPVPQASPVQKASPVPQPSPAEKVAPSPQVNPAPSPTPPTPTPESSNTPSPSQNNDASGVDNGVDSQK